MLLASNYQITVLTITNDDIEPIGDLTQYTSILWPTKFIGYGSCEIWAPITDTNKMLLKKGNVLWDGSDTAAIIECVKSILDEDGNKSFDVKGKTLEKWLLQRIVWGTVNYTDKYASTIIYDIVDKNCVNPTNPKRKIPWLVLDEDERIGNKIDSYQKTGGWVYDAVYNLALESDIGFSIFPNIREKRMVFKVESGTDRTIENISVNDPVVFETDLQDILSSSYYTNDEDLKNVAFVQGEDTGADRKNVTVGETESIGFERRELYVDARDLQSEVQDESGNPRTLTDEEYLQILSQRGSEKLAEYITIETFDAQIRQFGDVNYEYGEDFFLGDKVTVIDNELGVQVSARILEVEEDLSDKYELILKFGYSYPTILDKVKRQTS